MIGDVERMITEHKAKLDQAEVDKVQAAVETAKQNSKNTKTTRKVRKCNQ